MRPYLRYSHMCNHASAKRAFVRILFSFWLSQMSKHLRASTKWRLFYPAKFSRHFYAIKIINDYAIKLINEEYLSSHSLGMTLLPFTWTLFVPGSAENMWESTDSWCYVTDMYIALSSIGNFFRWQTTSYAISSERFRDFFEGIKTIQAWIKWNHATLITRSCTI